MNHAGLLLRTLTKLFMGGYRLEGILSQNSGLKKLMMNYREPETHQGECLAKSIGSCKKCVEALSQQHSMKLLKTVVFFFWFFWQGSLEQSGGIVGENWGRTGLVGLLFAMTDEIA